MQAPQRPAPGPEGWVVIAANPYSGHGENGRCVEQLTHQLQANGVQVVVAWKPTHRAQVRQWADEIQDLRCVVAAGGDGTIASLIDLGFSAPLGVLPLGNENLFAAHFGFEKKAEPLAHAILRGQTIETDLGQLGSRPFTLMVSAGIDADVVHRLARWRQADGSLRRVSRLSYVQRVLGAVTEYNYPTITLKTDVGDEVQGAMALVFNLPRYGMGLPFTPDARGDDALLDWVVFEQSGLMRLADYAWSVLRTQHLGRSDVLSGRAKQITLTSEAPVPLQADGDPAGFTPQTISVLPGALRVLQMQPSDPPQMR